MIIIYKNLKPSQREGIKHGAGDGSQLEPSSSIYLEIIKELAHSSTIIFDIKNILKYSNTN